MARQNKKTRIKGLPPKIQLQTKDSHTGSYPSRVRLASDNRTGKYSIFWNDTNALIFTSSANNVNLGTGLPNNFLQKDFYQDLGADMSSSINSSGSIVKGVADNQFLFTPGQNLEPYKDHDNFEVDGKSQNTLYYSVGSSVFETGGGFDQPLWSKTKIEIDITPSVEHSVSMKYVSQSLTEENNYPMSYWNHETKTWTGIGKGYSFSKYEEYVSLEESIQQHKNFFDETCIGFARGYEDNITFTNAVIAKKYFSFGQPISTFGFPSHPKFHATSSNTIKMSQYINKPFLLEKVVFQLSCSFLENETNSTFDIFNYPVNNLEAACVSFFLLNQKKGVSLSTDNAVLFVSQSAITTETRIINKITLPTQSNGIYVNSDRDLLTWGQVISYDRTENSVETTTGDFFEKLRQCSFYKEKKIYSDSPESSGVTGGTSWRGNIKLETTVKSKLKTPDIYDSHLFLDDNNGYGYNSSIFLESNDYSGRSINNNANGKNYLNSIGNPGQSLAEQVFIKRLSQPQFGLVPTNGYVANSKNNPYLLNPSDELILGFQLPTGKYWIKAPTFNNPNKINWITGSKGSEVIFHVKPSKVTLYGSYIKEGKEHHDTLNQLLISDNVHEIIGEE